MKAIVTVMLKDGVLDPQGKAIGHALAHARLPAGRRSARRQDHRAGTGRDRPAKAKTAAEDMAKKLLANTVIESFRVEISG